MKFYRQKILDHYKNPRNRGQIANADCHSHLDNPLCGDIIDVYLKISNNKIKDIKFKAEGCAISIAAMSMLSERVKGQKIKEVLSLKKQDILEMLGIQLSATRLKCGILGLTALRQCLDGALGRTSSQRLPARLWRGQPLAENLLRYLVPSAGLPARGCLPASGGVSPWLRTF